MACFVISNPAPLEAEEGHVQRSLHLHQAILITFPLSLCTLAVNLTDKPGGTP